VKTNRNKIVALLFSLAAVLLLIAGILRLRDGENMGYVSVAAAVLFMIVVVRGYRKNDTKGQ
jgi:hypothetical protein